MLLGVGEAGGQLPLSAVHQLAGDERQGNAAAEQLRQLGLVDRESSLAMEVTLTALGSREAAALAQSRKSGPDRRAAVQKGVLRWLRDRGKAIGSTEDFVGQEDATADGEPFVADEVLDAVQFLKDGQLITGIGTAQTDHLLRAQVTSLGIEALDDPRTPFEFLTQGGSTSYDYRSTTNIGDGNTIAALSTGSHNFVTGHQTMTLNQRIQVMAALADLLTKIPSDTPPEVVDAVDEIRVEAARPQPVLDTIKAKAVTAMATALGTGAGNEVVQLLNTFIQNHLS